MSLLQINPDLRDTLVDCYEHTATFAKVFFREKLWREFNSLHDELFYLLDTHIPLVAIAAPRGIGKTTLTILYALKCALFKNFKYILFVSETNSIAAQNVRTIGNILTGNEKIVKTFGNLQGPIWNLGDGHLKLANGVTIKARGSGQQIRGQQDDFDRPDLIICDDLEDPEPFRLGDATEYERKLWQWFDTDLMNSRDERNPRVIVVGTVLGELALLQRLLDDPDWKSLRLELCDDMYRSNFPDFKSDEQIAAMVAKHKREGTLDFFFQEYRNLPTANETRSFKDEYFQRYDPGYDPVQDLQIDRMVIIDPAKTVNISSADTAILGVGFNPIENHIYLIDGVNAKLEPDDIYKEAVRIARQIHTRTIAVEVTGIELFIKYPLNNYLRRQKFPDCIPLQAKGKKPERIRQLVPFYRERRVYHSPTARVSDALEAQLRTFPRSKLWDVMDCFAYAIPLFAIGERYFGPEGDDNEDMESFEAEIAAMDAEDRAMGGSISDGAFWAP